MNTKTINQTAILDCVPETAYNAWMDSKQHGEMTSGKAKIDPKVGGKFTAMDGNIEGEIIELDPKKYKIVQSWRAEKDKWPKNHFSKITVQFLPNGANQTKVEFEQNDIPEEYEEDVRQGWKDFYWTSMEKYFSSNV